MGGVSGSEMPHEEDAAGQELRIVPDLYRSHQLIDLVLRDHATACVVCRDLQGRILRDSQQRYESRRLFIVGPIEVLSPEVKGIGKGYESPPSNPGQRCRQDQERFLVRRWIGLLR